MSSAFLQEVHQHPAALRDLIAFYRGPGRALLQDWRARVQPVRRVLFTGMGTSEFVAESILPKLAEQNLDPTCIDAGELLHYPRPVQGLLVLVSQSGESIETKKIAERLSRAGNWVAITNNPQSTIATRAGLNLPMQAGHETAIATKTYANTLALLYLMTQPAENLDPALDRLEQLAANMNPVSQDQLQTAATLLADASALHFVGRGPAIAAAKQAALTFMEGTRTSATAFTGGAFRHGPYELIDSRHRSLFFAPGGNTYALLNNMAAEVAAKGSHVVIITDQDLAPPPGQTCVLKVPHFGEDLFSLSAAMTQELLLEAVARKRGVVAGLFRNSQKITAVE